MQLKFGPFSRGKTRQRRKPLPLRERPLFGQIYGLCRGVKNRLCDESGSAVIEVTIMFPIVLMLFFGFLYFTQAVHANNVLQAAAREAARYYAVHNDASGAAAVAKSEVELGGLDSKKVNVKTARPGNAREVTVEMPYPLYVPFAGKYDPTLKGRAVFKLEQNPYYN